MSDLTELQGKILFHLSSSGGAAVPWDRLQAKIDGSADRVSAAMRALLEGRRITMQRGEASPGGPPSIYLSLASSDLSESASLVYDAVRAAGASGVDQQQLASRLRMPKSDILKALRSLVQSQKIQEQRSFTNRAKKVYLLFHLRPSAQVTGGTLHCGEDLDIPLVDALRGRIVSYVSCYGSVTMSQIEAFVESQTTTSAAETADGAAGGLRAAVKREPLEGVDGELEERVVGSPIAFIHSSGGGVGALPGGRPGVSSPAAASAAVDRGTFPTTAYAHPTADVSGALSPPAVPLGSKRVQAKDVRTLVQSLVLDGVLAELLPPRRVGPSYDGDDLEHHRADLDTGVIAARERRFQLAAGANVMRHFTASVGPRARRADRRGGGPASSDLLAEGPPKRAREGGVGVDGGVYDGLPHPTRGRLRALYNGIRQEAVYAPAEVSRPSSLVPDVDGGGAAAMSLQESPTHAHPSAGVPLSLQTEATVAAPATAAGAGAWAYMPAVGFPCLGCPQLASCSATGRGVFSQTDCVYLADWLR